MMIVNEAVYKIVFDIVKESLPKFAPRLHEDIVNAVAVNLALKITDRLTTKHD